MKNKMKKRVSFLLAIVMIFSLWFCVPQNVQAEEIFEPVEFTGATLIGNTQWTDPGTSKTYNVYLNNFGSFKAATDKVPARGPAYISLNQAYKTRMDNTLGDWGSVYSPDSRAYYYFTLEKPTKVTIYAQSSTASNSSLSIEKIENIESFQPSTKPMGKVMSSDLVKSMSVNLVAGDYLVALEWGQGRPEIVGECTSYVKVEAECLINQESDDEWYETFPNYSYEEYEGYIKKLKYVCTPYTIGKTMNGVTGIGNVDSTNQHSMGYYSFAISEEKKLYFESLNNISCAYVFSRSEGFSSPTNRITDMNEGMILEPDEYVLAVYAYNKNPYSFKTSMEDIERNLGYSVTFNTNGGSAVEPASILVVDGEQLGTLPTTTKAGYTFAGWYSDKELTKKVTASTICKGEMNLYAKWTANKYSVKFVGGSGSTGTMAAISGTYKEGDVLPANTFKKTGYTFNGWKDADGKTYKNKADIAPLAIATKAKEVTLTAQWKKATYTITYELNGGTNAEANPATYTYTTADITLAKATKKGYTFAGWFSDETFTTKLTEIKKGSTGNKTLYAKWTKNKYAIEYVLNGGTNSADNPATYTVTTPTITLATPTRRGYKFSGWFSDEKFTTKVTEIAKGSTGKKTLYAKWAKNTYNITYVLNGGTNSVDNPASYTVTTETITLAKPTKKGYTFKGWFTDKECTKAITEIKKGSTGSKTLYAKWSANSYDVKFNGNGATSGTMADVTGWKYGKEYELPANAFKKTGYTFKGWATTATGEVKYTNKESVKNLSSTNNKTVNLYAIWAKTKYKITYNLDGGTNNAENPASFYYTTATITLLNPTKTGYTFGGWYSDSEFKTRVKTIEKGTLKSVTLYAKWTENAYSITFDANVPEEETATGSMDAITGCKYTQTVILPENAFAREGYTFVNWNTAADGSGTAYAAGEEVSGLTGKRNGTVTLYAQWSAIESAEPDGPDDPDGPENEEALTITLNEESVTIYPMDGFVGGVDSEDPSKCLLLSTTNENVVCVAYDLEAISDDDFNAMMEDLETPFVLAENLPVFYYGKTVDEENNCVILKMYCDRGNGNYVVVTVNTNATDETFNLEDYVDFIASDVME